METMTTRTLTIALLLSLMMYPASLAVADDAPGPVRRTDPDHLSGPMLPVNAADRCRSPQTDASGVIRAQCAGEALVCTLIGLVTFSRVQHRVLSCTDDPEGTGFGPSGRDARSHVLLTSTANGTIVFDSGNTLSPAPVMVMGNFFVVRGWYTQLIGGPNGGPPRVLFQTSELGVALLFGALVVNRGDELEPPRVFTCLHEWDWSPVARRYVQGAQRPGMTEYMCFPSDDGDE